MIIKESNRLNSVQEYYFSRKLKQIREMRDSGHDVLNLGIGNPDLMPSVETINELKTRNKDEYLEFYCLLI